MTRNPDIPEAFDAYTVVLLRRPEHAPAMSDEELEELQRRHLAYRAQLRRDGHVVVNGPLFEQSDESLRGLSIFATATFLSCMSHLARSYQTGTKLTRSLRP